MKCPNCARTIDPDYPTETRWPDLTHSVPNLGHDEGCILVPLLKTLADRGHDLTGRDIESIDADQIWEEYGGPATDAVAHDLGLTAHPA